MQVEIDIHSGRPNPVWRLDAAQSVELHAKLRALDSASAGTLPDGLGYRGLRVRPEADGERDAAPAGVIEIGAGRVHLMRADGTTRQLADTGRALERWLIETARGRIDEALRQMVGAEAAKAP